MLNILKLIKVTNILLKDFIIKKLTSEKIIKMNAIRTNLTVNNAKSAINENIINTIFTKQLLQFKHEIIITIPTEENIA